MISTVIPRLTRLLPCRTIEGYRFVYATGKQCFYEREPKSGYKHISDVKEQDQSLWASMVQGFKYLIEEIKVLKEDTKELLMMDSSYVLKPGEVDVQWRFDGDPKILDQWVVTCDSDYNEGRSTASFQLSKTGKGVFSGFIDPRPLKDGIIKRTGFCNIRSVALQKSPLRTVNVPWGPYTHLCMRVRGDGRNYLLTLATPGYYDLEWNDSFQYVLYTRGGPYWQYVKIPFSKFFLVSKGRIQDTQYPVQQEDIKYIGITASERVAGSFKLEFDFIGVEYDDVMAEEFAYELYRPPTKFHV